MLLLTLLTYVKTKRNKSMKKTIVHMILVASLLFGATHAHGFSFFAKRNILRGITSLKTATISKKLFFLSAIATISGVISYFVSKPFFRDDNPENPPNQNQTPESVHSVTSIRDTIQVPEGQCGICFEDEFKNEEDRCTLSCNHTFCKDCLNGQLDVAIQEKSSSTLRCPACRSEIDQQNIREIVGEDKLAKYQGYLDVKAQEYLRTEKDLKHCQTPDCTYVFSAAHGAVKQNIRCPQCRNRYCSGCLRPHPPDMSCEEAQENYELAQNPDAADKKSEEWKKANTKQCPSCNADIQRNRGCDHMRCRNCNYQFCWRCLGPYHTTACFRPRNSVHYARWVGKKLKSFVGL